MKLMIYTALLAGLACVPIKTRQKNEQSVKSISGMDSKKAMSATLFTVPFIPGITDGLEGCLYYSDIHAGTELEKLQSARLIYDGTEKDLNDEIHEKVFKRFDWDLGLFTDEKLVYHALRSEQIAVLALNTTLVSDLSSLQAEKYKEIHDKQAELDQALMEIENTRTDFGLTDTEKVRLINEALLRAEALHLELKNMADFLGVFDHFARYMKYDNSNSGEAIDEKVKSIAEIYKKSILQLVLDPIKKYMSFNPITNAEYYKDITHADVASFVGIVVDSFEKGNKGICPEKHPLIDLAEKYSAE